MQKRILGAKHLFTVAAAMLLMTGCGGSSSPEVVDATAQASEAETPELALGLNAAALSREQAASYRAGQPLSAVQVWITTPDGTAKLQNAGTVLFTAAPGSPLTITVDPTLKYQPVEGFGASITESSAELLYALTPTNRLAAMRSLFDRKTGNGLNLLRQPIGASDFVVGAAYTYDDLPAGQTDYAMQHFSIARDEQKIVPLLRQARSINPQIKIIATPWSPPAWMKTNGSLVGGELTDTPEIYQAYALYLVKFIQAYARHGIPIDAITLQNEPLNRTPLGYPGMHMSTRQQGLLAQALAPALNAAKLKTRILAYDHNWSVHPDDIAATPPGEPIETEYPSLLYADTNVAPSLGGVGYHCYYGTPVRQRDFIKAHPDVPLYITECSGSKSPTDSDAKVFNDSLRFQARNLEVGGMRNGSRTVINWNLALDPNGNPHAGGCATCLGVVTVAPDQTVTPNAEYYTLGHLSRFVKRGALRIASSSFGTPEWNGQLMSVAFRNPDHSTVLVVHNENDEPMSFAVALGNQGFAYTLPGGALATFVWQGNADGEASYQLLDPLNMVATANPAAPADPCCSVDVASQLIDDDAATRWSSGIGQQPGHYVQVDMGSASNLRRVVLDAGTSAGDFVRGYELFVSNDGVNWGSAVASGSGAGQLTTIDFAPQGARYVRVTSTAAAGSWWSVADLRLYK
jgi:glucosylceramidase